MIVFGVAVIFVTIGLVIVTIAKRRNNMDDNQEDHDFDRLEMTPPKSVKCLNMTLNDL